MRGTLNMGTCKESTAISRRGWGRLFNAQYRQQRQMIRPQFWPLLRRNRGEMVAVPDIINAKQWWDEIRQRRKLLHRTHWPATAQARPGLPERITHSARQFAIDNGLVTHIEIACNQVRERFVVNIVHK